LLPLSIYHQNNVFDKIMGENTGFGFKLFASIVLCAILNFCINSVSAQSVRQRIDHISTEDGLSQNFIDCILQDSRGFLWFGTWEGLNRYDGYNFKAYKSSASQNSLSNNLIHSLTEDRAGNLWVGTRNGLNHYDFKKNIFTRFLHDSLNPKSICDNWITVVMIDKKGSLWVGTQNNGLDRIEFTADGKAFRKITHFTHNNATNNSLSGNTIMSLYEDKSGNIWVGTSQGLNLFNKISETFTPYQYRIGNTESLSNNEVRCIFEDQYHQLWVGTASGLNCFNAARQTFKSYFTEATNTNTLSHNTVVAITETKNGDLLIGTLGGLCQFNYRSNDFYRYHTKVNDIYSLNNEFINCIYSDRTGIVWIGTEKGGINKLNLNQKQFLSFAHNPNNTNSLSQNIVNSIYEDEQSLWIGTAGGGLNKFNKSTGRFTCFQNKAGIKNSLSLNFVSAIYRDKSSKLWVATWGGGLNLMLDENAGKFKAFTNATTSGLLSSDFISSIHEDDFGHIWIGTSTGLDVMDTKTQTIYHIPLTENKNEGQTAVGCIWLDKSYNMWIGCVNGLCRLMFSKEALSKACPKPQSYFFYSAENRQATTLSGSYIISMLEDKNGAMWFSSLGNGLNKLTKLDDKKKTAEFEHISEVNGLANNVIYGILEDDRDNLWLSTDRGLSRYNYQKKTFRNYYETDGLLSNQFYWSSAFKNRNGRMYFGGMNGLNCFYPQDISDNYHKPGVVITDFKIFNKTLDVDSTEDAKLKQNIVLTKEISLNYDENVFSLDFAALSYEQPEKNMYAYKLEGVDKDWVYVPANRRFVSYTNLKGGQYIFKVKAANSDGIWNEEPTVLKIIVHPPFYATTWFRVFLVVLIVSLTIAYFQVRTARLRHQKKVLEIQVRNRTAQIEEQKEELSAQKEDLLAKNSLLERRNEQIENQKLLLEEQNAKIAAQRDELIHLNKKVKHISQIKLQFYTNISHEFRTPLTLILGPLDKLLSHFGSDDQARSHLLLIKKNAQRLLHLINELMEFRKIQTRKMELYLAHQNISKFVENVAMAFQDLAVRRNIDYRISTTNPELEMAFDRKKIEDILYNLISNAFKFSKDQSIVEVMSQVVNFTESEIANQYQYFYGRPNHEKTYFEISIGDGGIGIAQEQLQNIFKKFYRVRSAEMNNVIGSGIGLALTQDLIKVHNGIIAVNSEIGKGSVFHVFLPIETELPENVNAEIADEYNFDNLKTQVGLLLDDIQPDEKKDKTENISDLAIKEGTLLIVEDNIELREFMADHLSTNYKVFEAGDGKEGYRMAVSLMPTVIISDIMMPEMDGIQMCQKLKNDLSTSHIPIVLLTAKSDKDSQIAGFESGADGYMAKPFDVQVLEARIKNLIESRRRLRKLFLASSEPNPQEVSPSSTDERFLQKAIEFVKENIANPNFGAQELVDKMCVSKSLLHKKLTALTNQSAVDFITTIRLNKSVQLMRTRNYNISELAFQVGFNDPKYFGRIFKKHFGKTPTEYAAIIENPENN
jgi:ligand-binding sensor domain-containing protein/signal transduction histidine kinase/CheY-like chemotaxis protein/AraC-like DNA-binding protein